LGVSLEPRPNYTAELAPADPKIARRPLIKDVRAKTTMGDEAREERNQLARQDASVSTYNRRSPLGSWRGYLNVAYQVVQLILANTVPHLGAECIPADGQAIKLFKLLGMLSGTCLFDKAMREAISIDEVFKSSLADANAAVCNMKKCSTCESPSANFSKRLTACSLNTLEGQCVEVLEEPAEQRRLSPATMPSQLLYSPAARVHDNPPLPQINNSRPSTPTREPLSPRFGDPPPRASHPIRRLHRPLIRSSATMTLRSPAASPAPEILVHKPVDVAEVVPRPDRLELPVYGNVRDVSSDDDTTPRRKLASKAWSNDYDDEEVEAFYVELEKFYKEDRTFYKVFVGDFNAKIGSRRSPEELHIGTHGLEWNEQGERLSEFIMSTQTIHGNSQFQKPPALRCTWESPGGQFHNEIDHIIFNHKYCLTNVSDVPSSWEGGRLCGDALCVTSLLFVVLLIYQFELTKYGIDSLVADDAEVVVVDDDPLAYGRAISLSEFNTAGWPTDWAALLLNADDVRLSAFGLLFAPRQWGILAAAVFCRPAPWGVRCSPVHLLVVLSDAVMGIRQVAYALET
uniref:Reverse transcriptase domain-containing protein n=1 Tax=Heligmosomoides polygyrus TaxID=6339 RepID=A0A8L8JX68_HELPZ